MQAVIYIDILIVLNILITYLLLLASSHILRIEPSTGRILAASFLGGMYSLIILAPPFGFFLSILVKLILSLSIVTVCFKPRSLTGLARSLISFFAVNFAFAGLMFGIWQLFKPAGMQFQNGSVYFNFSFFSLIASAFVSYLAVFIFNRIVRPQTPEKQIYDIKIKIFDKVVEGKGFLDTGNNLTDGFMGIPVIVAKQSFVASLIPDELLDYFNGNFDIMQKDIPKCWGARIRLVPVITLNASTLLPSFRPEHVQISDNKFFKQVIVAVCPDKKLDTEYDCLLNTQLLNEFGGEKSEALLAKTGVGN